LDLSKISYFWPTPKIQFLSHPSEALSDFWHNSKFPGFCLPQPVEELRFSACPGPVESFKFLPTPNFQVFSPLEPGTVQNFKFLTKSKYQFFAHLGPVGEFRFLAKPNCSGFLPIPGHIVLKQVEPHSD
jgi:hypothetical protein